MSGSISLGGDVRRLMKHLKKLENLDLAGVNATLANAMRTSTRKRFKDGVCPDGKPWKPSIRAKESNGKTLVDTARLRNSIRAKSDNTGFAVGTNVVYARHHQFGDSKPVLIKAKTGHGLRFKVGGRWITKHSVRVQIPARPFLGINKDDIAEIRATLEEVVSEHG